MTNDIKQMAESCESCQTLAPSQPLEPLKQTVATHPMNFVGIDLFQWEGKHFLCMIDKFSSFPFMHKL